MVCLRIALDDGRNVDRPWFQALSAREGEELSGQRGATVGSAKRGLH